MKAMIFAAGLGTRLKPFTLNHPKALVPVAGVPMLQRVITKLIDAGVSQFVVNVHHFAEQIISFLESNNNFGVDIVISDERDMLLDTGGGILAARQWLDDDNFIVHNADILTDFDINEMCQEHELNNNDATLLVDNRKTSRYLLFDDGNRMRGWKNFTTNQVRPSSLDVSGLTPLAFGGVHILSPKVFSLLGSYAEPKTKFSITDFYIDTCASLSISAFTPQQNYKWHDIGKPESLALAQTDFAL